MADLSENLPEELLAQIRKFSFSEPEDSSNTEKWHKNLDGTYTLVESYRLSPFEQIILYATFLDATLGAETVNELKTPEQQTLSEKYVLIKKTGYSPGVRKVLTSGVFLDQLTGWGKKVRDESAASEEEQKEISCDGGTLAVSLTGYLVRILYSQDWATVNIQGQILENLWPTSRDLYTKTVAGFLGSGEWPNLFRRIPNAELFPYLEILKVLDHEQYPFEPTGHALWRIFHYMATERQFDISARCEFTEDLHRKFMYFMGRIYTVNFYKSDKQTAEDEKIFPFSEGTKMSAFFKKETVDMKLEEPESITWAHYFLNYFVERGGHFVYRARIQLPGELDDIVKEALRMVYGRNVDPEKELFRFITPAYMIWYCIVTGNSTSDFPKFTEKQLREQYLKSVLGKISSTTAADINFSYSFETGLKNISQKAAIAESAEKDSV